MESLAPHLHCTLALALVAHTVREVCTHVTPCRKVGPEMSRLHCPRTKQFQRAVIGLEMRKQVIQWFGLLDKL